MKHIKLTLTATLIVGITAVFAVNSAEARRYRHAAADYNYAISEGACAVPSPRPTYVYPAANWEPFFRRRVYRFGPVLVCEPSFRTTTVVSARF